MPSMAQTLGVKHTDIDKKLCMLLTAAKPPDLRYSDKRRRPGCSTELTPKSPSKDANQQQGRKSTRFFIVLKNEKEFNWISHG